MMRKSYFIPAILLLIGTLLSEFGDGLATQGQTAQSPAAQQTTGTNVLGSNGNDVSEEQFVETIVSESERLPVFGFDLFKIDTSSLTPGSINPQTYYVAPGDKLLLQVWGEMELSYELPVSPDTFISIPEVGRVYLGGQTLAEAETTITQALARIYSSYVDPDNPTGSTARIALTPVQIQEVRFLVQGEVLVPGSYSLHPSLSNLIYALAKAGGIRESGSLRNILIRRGNQRLPVDFYDFLLKGNISQGQIQLQNNDVIFVPLKTREVAIRGEIRRPARYEVLETETLLDLIEMSGGLKPSASLEKSLILRTELNQGMQTIDVNLKQVRETGKRVSLQDQDVVNVFTSNLLRIDYVSAHGQGITLPGEYQLRQGMRLKDLIEEAGGLTGEAYVPRADLIRTRPDMTRYFESVNLNQVLADDPKHNVELANLDQLIIYTVREIQGSARSVTLRGHVKIPGKFELYQGMTLFDLVFAKGGFQDRDFLKRAYTERGDLLRIKEGTSVKELIKFNLGELLTGSAESNLLLQAGDEIRIYSVSEVAASEHFVTLSGHVQNPGEHRLYEGMTLYDLLEVAGGFQDREFKKATFLERADLVRQERTGNQIEKKLIRFNLGALLLGDQSQNSTLEANDQVVIYSAADFTTPKTVSIDGFVKNPGAYSYAVNMTLGDLIVQAGGLLEGAYAQAEISRLDVGANPGVEKTLLQVDLTENFFQSDEQSGLPLRSNDHVFVRKHPDYTKQAVVEITGEVQFPGSYVLNGDQERISDLLRRAGGLKDSAHGPAAQLFRIEAMSETVTGPRGPDAFQRFRIIFNLEESLRSPASPQDLVLQHGDRLRIPRFENVVRVRGAVFQESTLAFRPGKSVDYYIQQAGGLIDSADKDNITVTYPDGRVLKQRSGFLGMGGTKIEPMSVIDVGATSYEF